MGMCETDAGMGTGIHTGRCGLRRPGVESGVDCEAGRCGAGERVRGGRRVGFGARSERLCGRRWCVGMRLAGGCGVGGGRVRVYERVRDAG